MDFTVINRLRLREAFASEEKFKSVTEDKDLLAELFECANRGKLFVYDDADKGHSVYVNDTGRLGLDKLFIANNPKHKDVFLWHIDGVMFPKDSKCDCAVLTESDMCFIEFKSNAANRSNEAIKHNYNKAYNQLMLTLNEVTDRCQQVDVNLKDVVNVKAFAVFNKTVPRNDALRKNISARFLLASGVKLEFANENTF